MPVTAATGAQARCSFCRKGPEAVKVLVAGLGVYICDQCVALAHERLAPLAGLTQKVPFDPARHFRTFPSDRLLAFAARIEPVHRDIDAQQTLLVSILRERAVSWAAIGQALGVTRQAAWRRFAGQTH